MPEISVIVPVYKAEKSIKKCVKSLLNQTFTDFELILVNDGSPDKSGDICETLAKEDERIIVINKDNGGVSSARNAGLDVASGKYVMFCDSDDSALPTWASTLYSVITQTDVDLAICHYKKAQDDFVITKHNTFKHYETKKVSKENVWQIYTANLLNSPWNKIFKRNIIEDNNIRYDEKLSDGEDLLFNLQYLVNTNKNIAVTNAELYCYFDNTNSLTTGYIHNFWQIKKLVMEELKRFLLLFGVKFENIADEYYGMYVDAALRCINNTLKKGNPDNCHKKFKTNREIMKSPEFRVAVLNSKLSVYNKLYSLCLKSRCYMLLWLYGKLSNLFHH